MEQDQREIDPKVLERIPKNWGRHIRCDEGWFDIIEELDKKLAAIDPDYVLLQCKEKFGGLRYYTAHSDGNELSEEAKEEFYQLVRLAESQSYKICEECGTTLGVDHRVIGGLGGWHATLCDADYSKAVERSKEQNR